MHGQETVSVGQLAGNVMAMQLILAALLRQHQGNKKLIEDAERVLAETLESLKAPEGEPYRDGFLASSGRMMEVLRG